MVCSLYFSLCAQLDTFRCQKLPCAPREVPTLALRVGGRSSSGRAPDCDSGGGGFKTRRPPHSSCLRSAALSNVARLPRALPFNHPNRIEGRLFPHFSALIDIVNTDCYRPGKLFLLLLYIKSGPADSVNQRRSGYRFTERPGNRSAVKPVKDILFAISADDYDWNIFF